MNSFLYHRNNRGKKRYENYLSSLKEKTNKVRIVHGKEQEKYDINCWVNIKLEILVIEYQNGLSS